MRVFNAILFAATLATGSSAFAGAAESSGRIMPVQDGTLYYEMIGEGDQPPLVLLNGGPGFDHSYLHHTPVWDDLSLKHRIVFFDQRGTGRSTTRVPADKITIAQMVADLEALRVKLGASKISLLGHSFGGYYAMAYATQHPDRVAKLILVDSGSPDLEHHEYLFDKLYPDLLSTQLPAQDDTPAGKVGCKKDTIADYDRMSFYDQRNRTGIASDGRDFTEPTCTAVMLDGIKKNLFPKLRELNVPTLVLNGRFDANVAPTVAFAISKAIPGSKLVYFERSGHTPFVEEPDRFELVVENFLDQRDRSGAR